MKIFGSKKKNEVKKPKVFEELIENTNKRSYSEYIADNMEQEGQQINAGIDITFE